LLPVVAEEEDTLQDPVVAVEMVPCPRHLLVLVKVLDPTLQLLEMMHWQTLDLVVAVATLAEPHHLVDEVDLVLSLSHILLDKYSKQSTYITKDGSFCRIR
jgi:hypothetical protein|tara:strand:- start:461 stop:763 length:303 start_codon:yes stop_codon:yes gene_type:complete